MENYIKEAKNNFFFDKTDSPHFIKNHARMMVNVLAYNLFNFLKTCCFDKKWRGLQVNTIRLRLFKVAGQLILTARQMYLKLSSFHVYQAKFYNVFRQIQRIRQSLFFWKVIHTKGEVCPKLGFRKSKVTFEIIRSQKLNELSCIVKKLLQK